MSKGASVKNVKQKLSEKFGENVLFDEPLSAHVAYRVGGPADALVFPTDENELLWLSDFAKTNSIPITVIGTGTNLLVRDEGVRGITVSLAKAFQEIEYLKKD